MTKENNWAHRAFPTLTSKEAETFVSYLDDAQRSQLEWMIQAADILDALPEQPLPPSLKALDVNDISRRFIFGSDPIPDKKSAEYLRRDFQYILAQWSKEFMSVLSTSVANALAANSGKTNPHKMRWLIWHLSDGNVSQEGVVKALAARLRSDLKLSEEFGFPAGPKDKKLLMSVIRNLIKDMRKVKEKGGRPFNLSSTEVAELEAFMEFEDLSDPSSIKTKR